MILINLLPIDLRLTIVVIIIIIVCEIICLQNQIMQKLEITNRCLPELING